MRSIKIEIAGAEYDVKANWRTSQAILDAVGDPMTIMEDFAKQANPEYVPKFNLGYGFITKLVHAAVNASGAGLKIDAVGDYVTDIGMIPASALVRDILVTLCVNGSQEVAGTSEGKP